MSYIFDDFVHGDNFSHGHNCIIESDVVVGNNVSLGHNVMLKSGTHIGDNVVIADGCMTTGLCYIGNNVAVRTGSCISKGLVIHDWVFIGAGVMSSHTKNVYHGRPDMPKKQLITNIGYGAVIGSRTNLMAGVSIAPGVVVGYNSNVVKDLDRTHGLYFGNPARLVGEMPDEWKIEIPDGERTLIFAPHLLEKYLPYALGE